jgi:hypothetical protein
MLSSLLTTVLIALFFCTAQLERILARRPATHVQKNLTYDILVRQVLVIEIHMSCMLGQWDGANDAIDS